MSKTVFRYSFDFLDGQKEWLNSMAERGWRLKKCGIATYSFDKCELGKYEYAIEFVGDINYPKAKDYRQHLESVGFRTFTKNVNLNIAVAKARWRPYAKGMGQIATSPGAYNKELLILEKERDGTPFELHTSTDDKLNAYMSVRRVYSWAVLLLLGLVAMTFIPGVSSLSAATTWALRGVLAVFGVLFAVPATKYHSMVGKLKEESRIYD